MLRIALRVLAVLAVFAFTVFLIPSSVPFAGAEEAIPEYEPVKLAATSVEPLEMGEIAPYAPLKSGFLKNKGGYLDDTISVQIKTTRAYDTKVFLTYVQIADPTQLRTAPAQANTFNPDKYRSKKIVNADIIAKRCKAVLAINGDYFIDRKEGCIVRNGVRLRSADFGVFDCLIIDTNGDFHILKTPTEAEFDAFEGEVMHSFSFGPGLVIDGEAQTDYNAGTMGGTSKKAQRQVICQMDKLSYLIVTTHGPEQSGSEGMSLKQLQAFLMELGVQQAYNLDGGSSTWLVLNNDKINHKSKRGIADIIYFATAQEGK